MGCPAMGIKTERQTVVECDNCPNCHVEVLPRDEAKKVARGLGWVIGRDVKCPECVWKTKKYGVPG